MRPAISVVLAAISLAAGFAQANPSDAAAARQYLLSKNYRGTLPTDDRLVVQIAVNKGFVPPSLQKPPSSTIINPALGPNGTSSGPGKFMGQASDTLYASKEHQIKMQSDPEYARQFNQSQEEIAKLRASDPAFDAWYKQVQGGNPALQRAMEEGAWMAIKEALPAGAQVTGEAVKAYVDARRDGASVREAAGKASWAAVQEGLPGAVGDRVADKVMGDPTGTVGKYVKDKVAQGAGDLVGKGLDAADGSVRGAIEDPRGLGDKVYDVLHGKPEQPASKDIDPAVQKLLDPNYKSAFDAMGKAKDQIDRDADAPRGDTRSYPDDKDPFAFDDRDNDRLTNPVDTSRTVDDMKDLGDDIRRDRDRKKPEPAQPNPPAQPPPPPAPAEPPPASGGLQNVTVNSQTVSMTLYDNGDKIDGDVVTISVNGVVIKSNYTLRAPPGETFQLQLQPSQNRIVVAAINEGEVPPNTAALSLSNVVQGAAGQTWSIPQDSSAEFTISVDLSGQGAQSPPVIPGPAGPMPPFPGSGPSTQFTTDTTTNFATAGLRSVPDSAPPRGYVPDSQPVRGYVPDTQPVRGYVPDTQPVRGYVPELSEPAPAPPSRPRNLREILAERDRFW